MAKGLEIRDDDELERNLRPMYEAMVEIWPNNDNAPPLPSLESCVLAHRYQESWAPSMQGNDGINLLVLGESHLSTDSSVLGKQIDSMEHPELKIPQLGHIHLVHCPSYGEITLLPKSFGDALSPSNRNTIKAGTWQFWRVLSVLSGFTDYDFETNTSLKTVFALLHKGKGTSLEKRLAAKADILRRLRQRRIMFADVCPAPIAVGGGNSIKVLNKVSNTYYTTKKVALSDAQKSAIIRTAWIEYSSNLVRKYKPRYVLVLGRSVLSSIGDESFQECLANHGGLMLGAMYHPSCNQAKSETCSRVMMQYLRQVALAACHEPGTEVPPFPRIDVTCQKICDIFDTNSNKKLMNKKKVIGAATGTGTASEKNCKHEKGKSVRADRVSSVHRMNTRQRKRMRCDETLDEQD